MTDWIMIAITAVYVIATIFICIFNYRSAKATREQLAESKRQFEENNHAFVTVTFETIRGSLLVLNIHNHGHQVANNVSVKINCVNPRSLWALIKVGLCVLEVLRN